jgi:hypothetical protein
MVLNATEDVSQAWLQEQKLLPYKLDCQLIGWTNAALLLLAAVRSAGSPPGWQFSWLSSERG